MKFINRFRCWFFGHPRGRRVSADTIRCPRCTAEWERKEKAKA